MTPEEQLFERILAAPEDDQPRREYGELLEQRDDPRGELIRIQLQIAEIWRTEGQRDVLAELTVREAALLAEHEAEWLRPVASMVAGARLWRGFIDEVRVDARRFVEIAPALYRVAPVLHLAPLVAAGFMEELCASPHLERMVSINLYRQQIGDEGARAIAASPHLGRLAWLELGQNGIGMDGLEALAASTRFPGLAWLGFRTNRVADPTDQPVEYEDDVIIGWQQPDVGAALEAKYGSKTWLHYRPTLAGYYPPA